MVLQQSEVARLLDQIEAEYTEMLQTVTQLRTNVTNCYPDLGNVTKCYEHEQKRSQT